MQFFLNKYKIKTIHTKTQYVTYNKIILGYVNVPLMEYILSGADLETKDKVSKAMWRSANC